MIANDVTGQFLCEVTRNKIIDVKGDILIFPINYIGDLQKRSNSYQESLVSNILIEEVIFCPEYFFNLETAERIFSSESQ